MLLPQPPSTKPPSSAQAERRDGRNYASPSTRPPPPPARSSPSPLPSLARSAGWLLTRVIPPSRLPPPPRHAARARPKYPRPRLPPLALSPQTLTLAPHRLAAAAGPPSARSVRGKAHRPSPCSVPVLLGFGLVWFALAAAGGGWSGLRLLLALHWFTARRVLALLDFSGCGGFWGRF
ncbi:hypothetical protein PVAP13_9KG398544 [Panicum virgatum]|uniref:Uncharacterized protein n=1 Tax=Panicum virgatum TaxID=38727 RepID=A0A8T0N724_PANVG|nr:hypothetical protein PVAP13_9KG398544 [Panicum virgatum]